MENKKYEIHQSPFYKLITKKKLSKLFDIDLDRLIELTDDNNYRIRKQGDRDLQVPKGELRIVHDKIQMYLSRLIYPTYLHSGVKKRSTITNADSHIKSKYMITMDITAFYASTKREYIKRMFLYLFHCSEDVSYILSELICFEDFLPTGSPLSQSIAFWSHFKVFEEINNVVKKDHIVFTLYVDDMTFSSETKIDLKLINKIKRILKIEELRVKNKKTKKYGINNYKIITGCVITPHNKLQIHNKHKKKAISLLKDIDEPGKLESLKGLISYCKSIDKDFLSKTNRKLKSGNSI